MDILQMRNMIISLKNEGQGAYHSPEEIDRALNSGSTDKFNEEKRVFERTSYISDNLSQFRKRAVVTLTAGSGPKPADYAYRTNAATNTTPEANADIINEGEWINRINDPIDPPSTTRPICTIRNTVDVYPTSLANIVLYYLRKPATMLFAYTVDGSFNISQNVGASVNCDWPDDAHVDIVLRALVYLGIPMSDDLLIKAKAYKKQTENV